jgi:flagellar hook-associated protein 3 FlgL
MISNLNPAGEAFLGSVQRIQRRVEEASRQASSGLRVNSPSDAPGELDTILQLRADTARNTQIEANLALAKTDAESADGALNAAAKLLDRARALGAQGANFTLDATGRQSIAAEVQSLLEQMVAISRTSVQGRYIFSGDDENTPPYQLDLSTQAGVAQLTTAGATRRLEDPAGGSFPVTKTAAEIFDARDVNGAPTTGNVFHALNQMRLALLSNDVSAINSAVANISTADDHLNLSQGFYGSVLSRIEDATNYGQNYDLRLRTELSNRVDADVAAAAMTITQGNTQLQAAFQMQARMPHSSLFDFLG